MREGLREEWKEEGRREVVRVALAEGMEIGMVAKISGLSEGEVGTL
uniref:Transposase n=1 Tax=Candidatus Kentrum sp. MB TaxID=2138164 RepID=A0A450XGR2_9GAMM|nr:MAG: hypothetical protein BECKMB1821G_GA0114241_100458 [Candidatus Kentron sp. MB]VFK28439.1 MAG: hypothetical protein BECKMB1821I_GA0114274_100656 [Candidatus Kentron sp. MB]VFK74253.1 MAG: hypothetical protein BECKMB1821H_GA0114242_100274 [Candidatus Kentron sp. MB]